MNKKRLAALETDTNRATLAELARRRGTLRTVVIAADATPDGRGGWQSETLELLCSLPSELYPEGLAAIGDDVIDVRPQ